MGFSPLPGGNVSAAAVSTTTLSSPSAIIQTIAQKPTLAPSATFLPLNALAAEASTTKGATLNYTWPEDRVRQGLVADRWPFRLDISVEYQDWILVAVTAILLLGWATPCLCGRMRNKCSKGIAQYLYSRLDAFFWAITYVNLLVLMFTIGVLPDWTINEYLMYLLKFVSWILLRLKKLVISGAILIGFFLIFKFQNKIRMAAGMEHVTLMKFNWKDVVGVNVKKRPVELYLWKVEDLQATKVYKAHDLFVECHLGDNEVQRTRVHNNAGTSCMLKESFQMNMNEGEAGSLMTLLVKDQSMIGSSELARLNLSTREICGVEDATGKRRMQFSYSEECFVELSMLPRGKVWLAIAPVCDEDSDEKQALLQDDSVLATC